MAEQNFRNELRQKAFGLARDIITSEGLAALQARRVAREAGCAVGTLYNVFGDMDGLTIAVNQETVQLLGEDLIASVTASQGQPVEARLTALALTYMRFALDNLNRWRAVFEHRLSERAEVPQAYLDDQAKLLALIEGIIASDVAAPELRQRAARALFAAIHGIIQLAVEEKLAHFDRATTEGEIRFIVSATANGLARARG